MATNTTAQDIVIDSIRMTGEYAQEGEDIPGWVQTRALRLLNQLLNNRSVYGVKIPLYTPTSFTMTVGKNSYEFSKLDTADVDSRPIVKVAFASININGAIYPVSVVSYDKYYKAYFSENTQGRPQNVLLKRGIDKSELMFYPAPSSGYTCDLQLKVKIDLLESQDILDELPDYWIDFLKYSLCKRQSPFFPSSVWTQSMQDDFEQLRDDVLNAADYDLSSNIDNVLLDGGDWLGDNLGVITS